MSARLTRIVIVLAVVAVVALAFSRSSGTDEMPRGSVVAGDDWVAGYAELSRYRVVQERYGEPRAADAVLIFVKEDFLPLQQVKFEGGATAGEQPVATLKLNEIRRFTTGIADYSLMRTVFTRSDSGETLKVTASVQDWCGQTWSQLNRDGVRWRARGNSYFQAEGDSDERLRGAATEDGLWTQLRLDPDGLPTGAIELIPSLFRHRLDHLPLEPMAATATLTDARDGLRTYRVEYAGGRALEIDFGAEPPFTIEAFREAERGRTIVDAVRTHTIETDYWNDLALEDGSLRAALGLDQ